MKKNKGFTLIEIVAVVVVLAIIALLITPVVSKIINTNREKLYDDQIKNIISSAKIWGADNVGQLPGAGEAAVVITLKDLQDGGYAKTNLKNPDTNEEFDPMTTIITITNNNGIINYAVSTN